MTFLHFQLSVMGLSVTLIILLFSRSILSLQCHVSNKWVEFFRYFLGWNDDTRSPINLADQAREYQ